jgi:subtilisin-like proprotein convertase family protein
MAGTAICSSGQLVCPDYAGPSAELCDNLDQDCDGSKTEGGSFPQDPLIGASCDIDPAGPNQNSNLGLCSVHGTRICNIGGVNPVPQCTGDVVPAAEICDGKDNDCDGKTDENQATGAPALPGENVACVANPDGTPNTTSIPPYFSVGECRKGNTVCTAGAMRCTGEKDRGPELCADTKDSDCDGNQINGVANTDPAVGQPCGSPTVGVCKRGTTACVTLAGPTNVVQCSGALPATTNVAVLAQTATTNAKEVSVVGVVAQTCDGIDNDCDGAADEGAADLYDGTACCDLGGLGCCDPDKTKLNWGTNLCSQGRIKCTYPGGTDFPAVEVCGDGAGGTSKAGHNLADDDCDGVLDAADGFNTQTDVNNCGSCGNVCKNQLANLTGIPPSEHGVIVCSTGNCAIGACAVGYVDADKVWQNGCELACTITGNEICDNIDNDCNGTKDDNLVVPPEVCSPFKRGICATANFAGGPKCTTGALSCDIAAVMAAPANAALAPNYQAVENRCDNIDNDCDGKVDEGLGAATPVKTPCDNGALGTCKKTGTFVCNTLTTTLCNAAASPGGTNEICDGADNDCDGAADEPCYVTPGVPASGLCLPGSAGYATCLAANTSGSVLGCVVDSWAKLDSDTWIYAYEARRPDANAGSIGSNLSRACSTTAAVPWTFVSYTDAVTACAAAGARLCGRSEFRQACSCGGIGAPPTNLGFYDYGWPSQTMCTTNPTVAATDCNIDDVNSAVAPTGGYADCSVTQGAVGVYDLSGNAKELTLAQDSTTSQDCNPALASCKIQVRGGAFNNTAVGSACGYANSYWPTAAPFYNVGFRCCSGPDPRPPVCTTYTSADVPKTTPESGTVDSIVTVPADTRVVSTIRVLDSTGTSTTGQFGDLDISLISPLGTTVLAVDNRCGGDDNWAFDLSDDAATLVTNDGVFCLNAGPVGQTVNNVYRPQALFSAYNRQLPGGNWTLRLNDTNNRGGAGDTETLTGWKLEVCTVPP